MTRFLIQINQFKREFKLSTWDWLKLVARYPIFWSHVVAKNRRSGFAGVCRGLRKLFAHHHSSVTSPLRQGRRYKIPIDFDEYGLENFREIFLGHEYKVDGLDDRISSFVDAGTNTGMAAIYFALKYPIERMALIEANPKLIPIIKKNVINNFSDLPIDLHHKCVSEQSDQDINFMIAENHRDSSAVAAGRGGSEVIVKSISLKDAVKKMGLDQVDLLKIDIEGSEHDLIKKDPDGFKLFKNIIAEVHGDKDKCQQFIKQIQGLGFKTEILADLTQHYQCLNLLARRY